MQLKAGVRVLGMRPELIIAMIAVQEIFAIHGVDLIITTGIEGRHSVKWDVHPQGCAFDCRSKHLPADVDRAKVRIELEAALGGPGGDFQVLLENVGGDNEHFHIAFRPINWLVNAPYVASA